MRFLRCSLLAAVVVAGCRGVTTTYRYPDDLTHPDYVKRTKAVRQFAAQRDKSQLPQAFCLLLDDEAHIRSMAYEAIREMMPAGQDFGYRSYLSEAVRIGIVARWEAWWRAQNATAAAEADLG